MKHLYVIGPVTGIKDDNRPEFEKVKRELERKCGAFATIPHELIPKRTPWHTAMLISIHTMTQYLFPSREPQFGIAMLDGWEKSKGARIEHDLAVSIGIHCKPWMEWL